MKTLSVESLYMIDYNFRRMLVANQYFDDGYIFIIDHRRYTSALIYANSCNMEITAEDGKVTFIPQGKTVYLPQGCLYSIKFIHTEKSDKTIILIDFEALDSNGESFVLNNEITLVDYEHKELFEEIVGIADSQRSSIPLQKAVLYKILSEIGNVGKPTTEQESFLKKYAPVVKGIQYIINDKKHEFSIAEIAERCYVSVSGFRKLFNQYTGVSPCTYRINQTIAEAKRMLCEENIRISEIAERLGFSDASYFVNFFKKHTGETPTEFSGRG